MSNKEKPIIKIDERKKIGFSSRLKEFGIKQVEKIKETSISVQVKLQRGAGKFWIWFKIKSKEFWIFLKEYVFHYYTPIGFLLLFEYYIFIWPILKFLKLFFHIIYPPKLRKYTVKKLKALWQTVQIKVIPVLMKLSFIILAVLFTIVTALGKLSLILFDIIVPRGLRELVPLLQMYRKYVLTVANFLSGKKSKEIIEVSQEIDEIVQKERQMTKAYPIRRAFGEVINVAIGTPLIIIAIPTIIGKAFGFQKLDLIYLFNYWFNLKPIWTITLFGTGLLVVSWVATIFGPIYALFHECNVYLMRWGAYRWANIYRTLENFFSLPYHAAKSSFSFFDAPPVSTETMVDFRLEIMEEVDAMKEKVQQLLSLDQRNVPERSKNNLEKLLNEAELSLNELDISKITKQTGRTFALLIWSKESSIVPWMRQEAKARFAKKNNMSRKEVEKAFKVILTKIEEGYISYDLFSSVLITGALKGVAKQQLKYEQIMPDVEYNKLAISLALGAQQYIKDEFSSIPWYERLGKKIGISLIAPLMPFIMLFYIFYKYIRHLIIFSISAIISIGTRKIIRFFSQRFKEISETLTTTYDNVKKRGRTFSWKRDLNIDFFEIFKKGFKFLVKLVPMIIWLFLKGIYRFISRIWTRRSIEEKQRRDFERELTTESLISMYEEIYDKLLITDLLLSK
ncbi:MAG: hypothetical protein KAU62_16810 [Candidatus Heimdallarchaeota archaeon]|nr:hypothetical protein [Candidatus Heimdallarchaeota archaeon]MCG3257769.1 hypothetical protein [Candidatus Heimdallarchaeota archaeon]MCK4612819.1 hypothetical protein [Candidatus Heimdallarchaeota archaeon]